MVIEEFQWRVTTSIYVDLIQVWPNLSSKSHDLVMQLVNKYARYTQDPRMWQVSILMLPISNNEQFFSFLFTWVLWPVKIISLILSRVNHKVGRKWEIPEKKHLSNPQAELGFSHMWP